MDNITMETCVESLDDISKYWYGLLDEEYGGFYGYVGFDRCVNKMAEKGGILNSRILWFFSSLYNVTKADSALKGAQHAYEFMQNSLLDNEQKGLYWMSNYKSEPSDTRKHSYNQAFAIYALSTYYKVFGDKQAVKLALELFSIIESKCKDANGYMEEFDRYWNHEPNIMLSENGVISERTMNTHLHILEAYTVLYEVTQNEAVKKQLYYLLDLIQGRKR
jgi:mannobiose 2-epimerase